MRVFSLNSSPVFARVLLVKLLDAFSGYVNSLFSEMFFEGLPRGLGLFISFWRSFFGGGIRYLMSDCDPLLDSLMTDLLVMRTWWVRRAHTLICLVVSGYPIKIPFYVLYMSIFDCFSAGMWMLALLPKIRMCSTFYLTVV